MRKEKLDLRLIKPEIVILKLSKTEYEKSTNLNQV